MVKDGGSAAQSLLAIKGFTETMAGSRAGGAVGQGISGIVGSLANAYVAGKGLGAVRALFGGGAAAAEAAGGAGAAGGSALAGAALPAAITAGGAYAATQTGAYKNASTHDQVMALTPGGGATMGLQNAGNAWTGALHGKDKAGWSGFFAGGWNGLFGNNNSDGMPSYAVGSYELPKDQVAQVHKGEMILPASIAAAVRKSVSSTGGSDGAPTHVEIKIMLQSGSDADVKKVGAQIKSIIQNPSMAKSMKES
jgi:hypothetical protein